MKELAWAAILLGASACSSSPAAPPQKSVVEIPTPPPVAASAPTAPASSARAVLATCDNDKAPAFDCAALGLGQCGAFLYYACPALSKLPPGVGFRPKIAASIGACLARPGLDGSDVTKCAKPAEACVREAVGGSCADEEATATCKRELGDCSPELQSLCSKLLTSLQPKTRASALEDMRQQRSMSGDAKSCEFSWDINGFPFCPYCPFRP